MPENSARDLQKQNPFCRTALHRKGLRRLRRRLVIGNCIVNLALPSRNLIVEIDGPARKLDKDYCKRRTAWFSRVGFNVMRFTDDEILKFPSKCANQILALPESESVRRYFWRLARRVQVKA